MHFLVVITAVVDGSSGNVVVSDRQKNNILSYVVDRSVGSTLMVFGACLISQACQDKTVAAST